MYLKDANDIDIHPNDIMTDFDGHIFRMKGVYCRNTKVYILDKDKNQYNPALCEHAYFSTVEQFILDSIYNGKLDNKDSVDFFINLKDLAANIEYYYKEQELEAKKWAM